MRKNLSVHLEACRIMTGPLATPVGIGPNGAFVIKVNGVEMDVIATDQLGWDHVSVSVDNEDRLPTWEEMAEIKDLFWDEEEAVMQLHPPQSQYVNNHPFVLHLWRPQRANIPLPPPILVGIKDATPEEIEELVRSYDSNEFPKKLASISRKHRRH